MIVIKTVNIVESIPETYHRALIRVVQKVILDRMPVWEIFNFSVLDPDNHDIFE